MFEMLKRVWERRYSSGGSRCTQRRPSRTARRMQGELLEDRQLLSLPTGTDFGLAATDETSSVPISSQLEGSAADDLTWKSVVFKGKKLGSLDFDFNRNVPTVNHDGTPIDVDLPRFGPPRSVVETTQWSVAVTDQGTIRIMGSGWDHDGESPMAVVFNMNQSDLIFYRGDDFNVENVVELTTKIDGVPGHYQDVLGGAVPGFRYFPRGAVVHEGLVVIQAQRDRLEGQTWIAEGITFITTQDYGATFSRVPQVGGGFEVPGIAGGVSDNMDRGREWAIANAFPENSLNDMLGVWFPWADYLHKLGKPKGGQIGLFRARRPEVGEPWVIEPNKLIYESWMTEDSGGFHAHSAGMFIDGMTSFWGDVGYRNMMVRHVADDLENYTGDVWTNIEEFQGAWSPEDDKVYIYGNQAAAAAPGPEFGEVLTTADEQFEVIMKVERPPELDDKAIITNLKGSAIGKGAGAGYKARLSLWIHRLRGRGYVVGETDPVRLKGVHTIHYSKDGNLWASMAGAGSSMTYLYGDHLLSAVGTDLFTARIPQTVFPFEPLIVNPGGTNLSSDTWEESVAPDAGWTFLAVTLQDGIYTYTDDGTLLDPQPNGVPPVADQMPFWEVTTDGSSNSGGRRALSGIDSKPSEHHWLTMWLYSLSGDGIEPAFKFGGAGNGQQTDQRAVRWFANNHWVSGFNRGFPSGTNTEPTSKSLWVIDGAGSDRTAPRRWLMVGEGLVQGDSPTYPLQPGQSGSDERTTIDGFSIRSEWTVALTFGLPETSAFSGQADSTGSDTIRPIATLVSSPSTRVEVNYTGANQTLFVDVYSNSFLIQKLIFPGVYLDQQDKVNLIISSSDEEFAATLQGMRGAYPITHQVQTSNGSIRPIKIYLSNVDRTVVTPLEWYAVQVNESVALTSEERAEFIASDKMFTVLDAGDLKGDMDVDGDIDFDDIEAFVLGLNSAVKYKDRFTVSPVVHGDADGDGDLDVDDIDDVVLIFSGLILARPGDLDFDDDVDFDDIDDFVLGLTDPQEYEEIFGEEPAFNGDTDSDDDLDFDDIPGFVDLLSGNQLESSAQQVSVSAYDVPPSGYVTWEDARAGLSATRTVMDSRIAAAFLDRSAPPDSRPVVRTPDFAESAGDDGAPTIHTDVVIAQPTVRSLLAFRTMKIDADRGPQLPEDFTPDPLQAEQIRMSPDISHEVRSAPMKNAPLR